MTEIIKVCVPIVSMVITAYVSIKVCSLNAKHVLRKEIFLEKKSVYSRCIANLIKVKNDVDIIEERDFINELESSLPDILLFASKKVKNLIIPLYDECRRKYEKTCTLQAIANPNYILNKHIKQFSKITHPHRRTAACYTQN